MTKNIQTAKLNAAIDMLIESDADLSNVLGKEGLIKQLSKRILERALEAEMQSHLGYERYSRSDIDNARNGSYQKNLITNNGQIELTVPRDRKGQFEPVIVKKKQSRIDGLDEKIISLYAKGMSISDIKIQLEELYGAEVSESLISRVTDDVIDEVKAWQSRALEAVYPIVFFDCLVVKVRQDKRIINKSVYIALGIDLSGHKDILGLWISDNEGAKFWLNNLTEMKNELLLINFLKMVRYCLSSLFSYSNFNYILVYNSNYITFKKHRFCAWDSNPGPQNGRH